MNNEITKEYSIRQSIVQEFSLSDGKYYRILDKKSRTVQQVLKEDINGKASICHPLIIEAFVQVCEERYAAGYEDHQAGYDKKYFSA